MIIDAHCHLTAGLGTPARARSAFVRALARARRAGIDRVVVFSGFREDYRRANAEVARLVAGSSGRLLGFGCVHAERDRRRAGAMISEAVKALGLPGVKVHRRDAPLTDEICRAADALGAPVLYDPMGDVAEPVFFARRYPSLAIIVPHLGSFADDATAQRKLLGPLAQLPNLFADTSGVKLFDVLEEAVAVAGPRKLIFGSDAPWLHPGLELAKIRALGLPENAEADVLGWNLLRLVRRAKQASRGRVVGLSLPAEL